MDVFIQFVYLFQILIKKKQGIPLRESLAEVRKYKI